MYTETAGLAEYLGECLHSGLGVQTFSLKKSLKKYETNLPTPHFVLTVTTQGEALSYFLVTSKAQSRVMMMKDSESYYTVFVSLILSITTAARFVIHGDRDPNFSNLPAGDYIISVTDGSRNDSFDEN